MDSIPEDKHPHIEGCVLCCLDKDIGDNPHNTQEVTLNFWEEISSLVEGVEVDLDNPLYEKDDRPITADEVQILQCFADASAISEGKIAPSKIPEENWVKLF